MLKMIYNNKDHREFLCAKIKKKEASLLKMYEGLKTL